MMPSSIRHHVPEAFPASPREALAYLTERGAILWSNAQWEKLAFACQAVPDNQLSAWPGVARWRALTSVFNESGEALACLEQAYAGHLAEGDEDAALVDARVALMLCLIDVGAMDEVTKWNGRSVVTPSTAKFSSHDELTFLFLQLGLAASGVLNPSRSQEAEPAWSWLRERLKPLAQPLAAHERLLIGQVLLDVYFEQERFEQCDAIATIVETTPDFDCAAPLPKARWLYTLGFAHYQVGQHEKAEAAWSRGLLVATESGLGNVALLTKLAMMRLFLDRGRLEDAVAIEATIQLDWGTGRASQLMEVQQLRARLLLLKGHPAKAHDRLTDAINLAKQAGLPDVEQGSLQTDEAQILIALHREGEAADLLDRLATVNSLREAAVFRCLERLLMASLLADRDDERARSALEAGLRQASAIRYSMFFRLLPALAGRVCALALRWQVEVQFVLEVIRDRNLPAPQDADSRWPWHVWIRMIGGFELRVGGKPLPRSAKPPHKPLELLRLLACQTGMSMGMAHAADELWPDSEGPAAHKSLEMTVQRLRRLLNNEQLVLVHEGVLSLDSQKVGSDVLLRRALVRRLESLAMQVISRRTAQVQECRALAQRLVAEPPGTLLPDSPEASWLDRERTRCAREGPAAARAASLILGRQGELAPEDRLLVEFLSRI